MITAAKGAAIGGTMLIPGVSGGTMAIMLGIYDRLISAVSSFRRHKRESFFFLLWFCLGAGCGMLLLAKPLLCLMELFPKPAGCFFMGAVAGSIPMTYQKSSVTSFSWRVPVYVLIGVAIVLLLSGTPSIRLASASGPWQYALLVLSGIFAAAALVLPGISVSYLFLVLGLYDQLIRAIDSLDLLFLLPLALGLVLGIILTTKLLEHLMSAYPQATYLIILGFVIASVPTIFPGTPSVLELIPCVLTFLGGFVVVYQVSKL